MEQYAKYLRKSRFDRDYAEMSVEKRSSGTRPFWTVWQESAGTA